MFAYNLVLSFVVDGQCKAMIVLNHLQVNVSMFCFDFQLHHQPPQWICPSQ